MFIYFQYRSTKTGITCVLEMAIFKVEHRLHGGCDRKGAWSDCESWKVAKKCFLSSNVGKVPQFSCFSQLVNAGIHTFIFCTQGAVTGVNKQDWNSLEL